MLSTIGYSFSKTRFQISMMRSSPGASQGKRAPEVSCMIGRTSLANRSVVLAERSEFVTQVPPSDILRLQPGLACAGAAWISSILVRDYKDHDIDYHPSRINENAPFACWAI
jgi:hypothetical protein